MTIDSPGRQDALSETVFAGPADVVHDLLFTILDDCLAYSISDRVERFVPRGAFPPTFASFAGAFERVQDAIGIGNLVESCGAFRAVASSRAGVFGIPFKLLHLARDLVDIGQQPA